MPAIRLQLRGGGSNPLRSIQNSIWFFFFGRTDPFTFLLTGITATPVVYPPLLPFSGRFFSSGVLVITVLTATS
jgi:hypothetical protein